MPNIDVVYNGPSDAVDIPELGNLTVAVGDSVSLPDEVAGRLLEQDSWTAVVPDKKKAPAPPASPDPDPAP